MFVAARVERFMRWTVLAVVVGTGALFLPRAANVFHLPKATLLVIGALALLAAAAVGLRLESSSLSVRLGELLRWPLTWVVIVFALSLLASTLAANDVVEAVVGDFGRYAGMATYLAYLVFFLVSMSIFRGACAPSLLKAVLVAGLVVAAYGMLQAVDLDPIDYQTFDLPGVFSTMGNPNFASAYVGLAVPAAAWCLVSLPRAGEGSGWWWVSALYLVLAGVVMAGTQSIQGPLVAVAGALVVTAVGVWQRATSLRAWVEARTASSDPRHLAATGLGLGVGVAVPVVWLAIERLGGTRIFIYEVAIRVFLANPWTGVGLGSFVDYFYPLRSAEHARVYANLTSNTAHSVPLELLAGGGVFLAAAYGAIVLLVAWRLAYALVRLQRQPQMVVAGLGGVWLAYQVQSLISIDVPALALIHWTAAGALLGFTTHELAALEAAEASGSKRSRATPRRRSPQRSPSTAAVTVAALAVVAALPFVTRPLRADLAAAQAVRLLNAGGVARSLELFERSQELYGAEAMYHYLEAASLDRLGEQEQALAPMIDAAEREPGSSQYATYVARFARVAGDDDLAVEWYLEAVSRDPRNVDLLLASAAALEEYEQGDAAARLYRRVLELDPGNRVARERLNALTG